MRFSDKIEGLLASGKLTGDQAAILRRSLQSKDGTQSAAVYHKSLPVWTIALAIVVLAAIFMIAGGQEDHGAAVKEIQNVAETFNSIGKVGEMNNSASHMISWVLIGLPILISLIWFALGYNGLVSKEEDVLVSWAQVEAGYQRRADLIPNLVNTVKAYEQHESGTLSDITRLRAQADVLNAESQKIKFLSEGAAAHLNDENYMNKLADAQNALSGNLKGLMVAVESYPALKASDQFLALQAEIEGTENRIAVARMAYNEKVGNFNAAIRKIPGVLMAGAGNFQRKAYFKAEDNTQKAPKVFETAHEAVAQ